MIKLFQSWRKKENSEKPIQLSDGNIPEHVAIIMDGNGRWAKKLGLPRVVGHRNGMKAVKRAAIAADALGIRVLTLYAFSTENWKRPKDEVDYLMSLPREFLALELEELIEKNVQVRMMGYTKELPQHTIAAMEEAIARTKDNDGLILNFALNYGGRREISESVKEIARAVKAGELDLDDINEETVQSKLLSAGLPEPDLLIRTSGELRLSNFMLWQTAYSELCFPEVYWPEFGKEHLIKAVAEYQRRSRRYGGLS